MSKNLFPQIAKMLNVEIGEEFKLQEIDNKIYKIELNGFWQRAKNRKCWDSMEGSFFELNAILMGKITVVKMPFKPKCDEECWAFSKQGNRLVVVGAYWSDDKESLLEKGWVYRTKKQAESALLTLNKEMERRK